ncbi:probable inactive peptidyl-prolyl cis-trans isomerase-like 6 isoform X6 [Pan troglodytes]|uniref:probable inactive peptidyl-prolyl cis-trans isomerase-like 6 isoform X6 n=1 Tax=Pan troglodytes TaxID=9598 RepID=UPI0007DB909A|nr:probable inactive peptidyl-prolyl cis-trans isomerase-like 6 isoform X6 [Pan troglodytes]
MARPQPCGPPHARCGSPSLPERPLQVKVVGLFSCPNFQIAKSAAENLKNNHPSKFEDPILVPLQEFAWHQYLQEKKRELKNETWEYSSSVISFVNGQFLGDALDLQKWAHEVWDIVDIKPSALYDALTEDFSAKFLRDTKHDFVFLDICIDSSPIGRLIFELYCDVCPKTCKNFQVLCTGKAGFSQRGIRLHYKNSIFHRIVQNGWIQGGDIVYGKGDNGESIYGPTFEELCSHPYWTKVIRRANRMNSDNMVFRWALAWPLHPTRTKEVFPRSLAKATENKYYNQEGEKY